MDERLAGGAEEGGEEPWEAALRQKVSSLLEGPPLTAATLRKVSEVCRHAADVVCLLRDQPPPSGFGAQFQSGFGWSGAGPPASPLNAETFGATAIRQLLQAIPRLNRTQDPAALVRAMAAARDAGLEDVAASLREELLGGAGEEAGALEEEGEEEGDEEDLVL